MGSGASTCNDKTDVAKWHTLELNNTKGGEKGKKYLFAPVFFRIFQNWSVSAVWGIISRQIYSELRFRARF